MSTTQQNDSVQFVRQALTTHVRQVRDFCLAGRARLADGSGRRHTRHVNEFLPAATRLINNAEQMVLATRIMPKPHGINAEQLEAEIQQAREAVQSLLQGRMAA